MDGWRLANSMFEVGALETRDAPTGEWQAGYPPNTRITDALIANAKALLVLFRSETPLMAPPRPTDAHKLRYCVGDASTEGFTIVTCQPNISTENHDGLREEIFAEDRSNLREA